MKHTFTTAHITVSLIAFIILGIGALLFTIPSFQHNISLATASKSERFTELYFDNHLNLPKSNTLKQPQTFSFTIHNLENKTIDYPYEIYIEDTAGSRSGIITNSVRISHDQVKTITESFEILAPVKRAKVVVNLMNKKQEIHFWIGEDNK
jgi:hypothetical protein